MANHSHRHQRLHCPYHFSDVARLSSQDFRTLQRIWYHWRYVMAATIATGPLVLLSLQTTLSGKRGSCPGQDPSNLGSFEAISS